jgi:hypothetical protein
MYVCVCVCVRECMRVCVDVYVCVWECVCVLRRKGLDGKRGRYSRALHRFVWLL